MMQLVILVVSANINAYLNKCSVRLYVQWYLNLVMRKPVIEVSDRVRHQPVCATTKNAKMLEL